MGNRVSPAITSFIGGEVSALRTARIDEPGFNASATTMKNFIPQVEGPLKRRPGTVYIGSADTPAIDNYYNARLIPFVFNDQEAYVLHFYAGGGSQTSNQTIDIYQADGVKLGSSLTHSYSSAELDEIQVEQIADVMYVTHPNHAPITITRTGSTTFVVGTYEPTDGPFLFENTTQTTVINSNLRSGSITVNSSPGIFSSTDIGRLIQFRCIPQAIHNQWTTGATYSAGGYVWSTSYESANRINVYRTTAGGTAGTRAPGHDAGVESDGTITDWEMVHSEYGYARITGFVTTAQVFADVVNFPEIPLSYVTGNDFRFALGAWSDTTGYPRAVNSFQQRLWFAGTTAQPQNVWGSRINAFDSFYQGTANDNESVTYQIVSDTPNPVTFMSSGRNLIIGTEGGQFIARGEGDLNGALTPTSVQITRDTSEGVAYDMPTYVNKRLFAVGNGNKSVRTMVYNERYNSYNSIDVSINAEQLTNRSVRQLAYQRSPDYNIWMVADDGSFIGCTYYEELGVNAWHQHALVWDGAETVVRSLCTVPNPDASSGFGAGTYDRESGPQPGDRLFLADKDGRVVFMTAYKNSVAQAPNTVKLGGIDNWLDYSVSDNLGTNTIANTSYLIGTTVQVNIQGFVADDQEVTGSSITLPEITFQKNAGFVYTAEFVSVPLETGGPTGTSQGKSKRNHKLVLRLDDIGPGLQAGSVDPETGDPVLDQVTYRDYSDDMNADVPPFSGDTQISPPSSYRQRGVVAFAFPLHQPCTIVGVFPEGYMYDEK